MAQNLLAPAALLRTGATHDRNVSPLGNRLGKDSRSFIEILGRTLAAQPSKQSVSVSNNGKSENLIPDLLGIILKKSTPENAAVLALGHASGNQAASLPLALNLGGELGGRVLEAGSDVMGRLAANNAVRAVKDGNRESLLSAKKIGQDAGTGKIRLSGLYSEENLQSARELVNRLHKLSDAARAIRKEGALADSDPSARLTVDPMRARAISTEAGTNSAIRSADHKSFVFETASNFELKAFERLNVVKNENFSAASSARFDAALLSQAASLLRSEGFSLLKGKSFSSGVGENSIFNDNASRQHVSELSEAATRVQRGEKAALQQDAARKGVSEQNARSLESDDKKHSQLEEAALKGDLKRLARGETAALKDHSSAISGREIGAGRGLSSSAADSAPLLNLRLDALQNTAAAGEKFAESRLSSALMERMLESAEWIRQNAKPTVRLQLAPQFLGGMEISLEAGDKAARLHIVAERGQVARALEGSAAQLALKLSEAGMPVEEIVVEHEAYNFAGQQRDDGSASQRFYDEIQDDGRSPQRNGKLRVAGNELIGKGSGSVSYHDGDIDLMA